MNTEKTLGGLAFALLLGAGCASTATGVRTVAHPGVQWSAYRTFVVQAANPAPPADAARASARKAVQETIDAEFMNRGLKPAPVAEADLEVVVMGKFVPDNNTVRQQTLLTRGGNLQVDYVDSAQAVPQASASLAIALVDTRNKQVVWSAGTDQMLYQSQPTAAQAANLTQKLLATLPPELTQPGSLKSP